jgi:hypothetical protein
MIENEGHRLFTTDFYFTEKRRRWRISGALAVARVHKQSPGSCARRSAWRGSTAIRASGSRPAIPLLPHVVSINKVRVFSAALFNVSAKT